MEDNDNSNKTESNQEGINKVLEEIAILKAQVSRLETVIESSKFAQLQLKKIGLEHDNDITVYIPYGQENECGELGKLSRKINQRFVFEINSPEKNTDLYVIEILIDENGRGKLEKTSLSTLVNVQGILSQYPIDDLNNIKHFIKSCKHQVDCFFCRLKQLQELKDSLSENKNINVCHNESYIIIQLSIIGLKNTFTGKFYDITLQLCYEHSAMRPYKLKLDLKDFDTYDNKKPSSLILKKLEMYFNPFLEESLNQAFLKIIGSSTKFEWPNNNADVMEVSKGTNILANPFHRDYIKRQKKSKSKVQILTTIIDRLIQEK